MRKELRLLALLVLTVGFFVGCGEKQEEGQSVMEESQETTETNWQPEVAQPEADHGHVHGSDSHAH